MKIKLTTLHVDDQERALQFYTEVLGFTKKTDVSQGPYRWLTVGSPDEPEGVELQLALNDNPAAKEYQQALFQQGQPAAMFFTDDVEADYERIKDRGRRIHDDADQSDRIDHRTVERFRRQPHPAHGAGPLLERRALQEGSPRERRWPPMNSGGRRRSRARRPKSLARPAV